MVERTLRLGPGLAERSPLPPWGKGGRGKLICGGWGKNTRWMRLEFDMRWDLSVLQSRRCFCSLDDFLGN